MKRKIVKNFITLILALLIAEVQAIEPFSRILIQNAIRTDLQNTESVQADNTVLFNSTTARKALEISNDTIAAQQPVNLRVEDFLYYPYVFLKPEYKDFSYDQLLEYLSTFHPELSVKEEREGEYLILRINNLKAWNKSNIEIKASFGKNGKIVYYGVSTTPAVCWYERLINDLKKRGYRDVTYERKDYWHYVKAYRSGYYRNRNNPTLCKYDGNPKVFYPAEIECYCYNCYPSVSLVFHY